MSKILVIEDDPQTRHALIEILTPEGHEMLEAQDGRKGLDLFRLHRPTIVITAILMPDMDGLEMIQELRGEAPGVGIIAVSDGGPPRGALYLKLAKMMGADEAIAKPLNALKLVAAVNRLA